MQKIKIGHRVKFRARKKFSADLISGSPDFTHGLTSGELILIHSAEACLCARVHENMLGYLSSDIICSEKRTVFRERSSTQTVSFEEQIMSKDK